MKKRNKHFFSKRNEEKVGEDHVKDGRTHTHRTSVEKRRQELRVNDGVGFKRQEED